MAEQEWAAEPTPPPKKKGVPGWLWFCGGGCLIATVLAVVGGFFLFDLAKTMADPEIQWPKFEEFVEVDERPEGWIIIGMPIPGVDVDAFVLTEPDTGTSITLLVYPESEREGVDELFGGEFQGGGLPGISEIEDPEVDEVVVQGRKLRIVRFAQSHFLDEMDGVQGAFLDITPDGDPRPHMMQIITQSKDVRVGEEVLEELLAPFVLGPDR